MKLRPILECPGYSASDDGRIFSHWHRVRFGSATIEPALPPRELAQFDRTTLRGDPSPYLSVSCTRDGRRCNRFVHELVLLAWVGPRPGSPDQWEACHGPGGSKDNRVSNLRWDTVNANTRDRLRADNYGGRAYPEESRESFVPHYSDDYAAGEHAFSGLVGAE